MQERPITGRIALVLGAGRGIGAAVARGLAESGYHVLTVARTESELARAVGEAHAAGLKIESVRADITSSEEIRQVIALIAREHGRLDLMVFAAGWARVGGISDVDSADLEFMLRVHLVAPYRAVQVARELLAVARGTVVIIGSRAGRQVQPKALAYGLSKTGVTYLTQALSVELRSQGISVFSVHPSAVATKLRAEAFPHEIPDKLPSAAEVGRAIVAMCAEELRGMSGACIDLPW